MTSSRPPSTPPERATRTLRSMSAGSLDGRTVSAYPIGTTAETYAMAASEDTSLGGEEDPSILPYTNYYTPTAGQELKFRLRYAPYVVKNSLGKGSFHVYWNNVLQRDVSYTLSENILTLSDPFGLIRSGDVITVKYWYDADFPQGFEDTPDESPWGFDVSFSTRGIPAMRRWLPTEYFVWEPWSRELARVLSLNYFNNDGLLVVELYEIVLAYGDVYYPFNIPEFDLGAGENVAPKLHCEYTITADVSLRVTVYLRRADASSAALFYAEDLPAGTNNISLTQNNVTLPAGKYYGEISVYNSGIPTPFTPGVYPSANHVYISPTVRIYAGTV